jgi:hypothetical protein
MKLAKAFKFFTDSKTVLYDLQNRASQIIQEDKVEGTLCLSVHPLDFLSSSMNTYNWIRGASGIPVGWEKIND